MQVIIQLNTEPFKTNTIRANCIFCGTENKIVEKLFLNQSHWVVDQNCESCGERLRNLAWRQYEPNESEAEQLDEMRLTFSVICNSQDADRLGWLNDLDTALNEAIANVLELTGKSRAMLTTIAWNPNQEVSENETKEDGWYGDEWD